MERIKQYTNSFDNIVSLIDSLLLKMQLTNLILNKIVDKNRNCFEANEVVAINAMGTNNKKCYIFITMELTLMEDIVPIILIILNLYLLS